MSLWSLVKIEVPNGQHASVISEVGCITVCVTAGARKVCFAGGTSKFTLCFCVAGIYLFTAAQGGSAPPVQKALGLT